MRINTNVASLNAQTNGTITNNNLTSSLEKLSSGLKINKASDDASGMAIADKLRTQASSLGQGISNANSGTALIQIADKAMAEQSNILDIVKTKLIQAATSTTSAEGREAVRKDVSKLLEQLDNISAQTNYNGVNLLDTKGADFTFQVGEDATYDIGLQTAYAVNTSGLGAGEQQLNEEDSVVNYKNGITIADVGAQATVQYDTTLALASPNAKSVVIGENNVGTITGLVSLEIAADNVAAIGFNAGGGFGANMTLSTDDAALQAALTSYAGAVPAQLLSVGDGKFEVVNGEEFVIEFASNIDISKLEISGMETGLAAADIVNIVTDEAVSITKTSGAANVSLESGTYTGAVDTIATGSTALVGKSSATAEGLTFTAAGTGPIVEKGTTGVQFDFDATATTFTAQGAVLLTTTATLGGTEEAIFTLNANNVTSLSLGLSAAGTSSITLSTSNKDTMAMLDEMAANSGSLTQIGEGTYTFEQTSTIAAVTAATLDFGGSDIKDLTISGMKETEDIAIAATGGVYVTKDDTSDKKDIQLSAVTLDGNTGKTTTAGSLKGASGDVLQTTSSLAGLATLGSGELTADVANQYMAVVDNAMTQLNSVRSDFGSTQGQLEVATRNMMVTQVNIKAAESVIRDTDYAAESANFNKQNIIAQAGTYAMSQANAMQQNVLRLLQ